jgi:hypothetical protein
MTFKNMPPGILNQRWLHSHEEDEGDEKVFRPDGYPFPPSRGRIEFELRPDGSVAVQGIAPTDGPQQSDGIWSIDQNGKLLIRLPSLGPETTMYVASMSPSRLTVTK